jgi:hypothetical protein
MASSMVAAPSEEPTPPGAPEHITRLFPKCRPRSDYNLNNRTTANNHHNNHNTNTTINIITTDTTNTDRYTIYLGLTSPVSFD